jgi:hypothetical protein
MVLAAADGRGRRRSARQVGSRAVRAGAVGVRTGGRHAPAAMTGRGAVAEDR